MSSQTYVDDHLMCAIVGNGFILIFFCISNGFPNPNPSKTDLPSPSQTLDLGAAINLGFDSTASGHRLRISSLSHDLLSSISQLLRRKNVHHTQELVVEKAATSGTTEENTLNSKATTGTAEYNTLNSEYASCRSIGIFPTKSVSSFEFHGRFTIIQPPVTTNHQYLQDGELIHGEIFNLFATMSAVEIIDPKMDSGIVCRYYYVDEAIEDGAAPVPLSLNKIVDVHCMIDIMDHLLSCEETWHKGHSLAQTIFSCIYLLRPDRTQTIFSCIYLLKPDRTSSHALLHSYCTVIRSTCNAVISAVFDSRTHEPLFLNLAFGAALRVFLVLEIMRLVYKFFDHHVNHHKHVRSMQDYEHLVVDVRVT
ncbi:hypothetical protein L2E82_34630 [Cichorium intybus]|uniref:Uncharacterized protein n=1 Tax=Cichorium intybus TaxID=13427 RepID=A0ACB9BMJ0_CICIN|nr:hypothetical protein L2E82_34630 [Cichorium intybus]